MAQHDNAWWAVYRLLNRNRLRAYANRYYHNSGGKKRSRDYYYANLEKSRLACREKGNRARRKLLFLLGNKCTLCGFSDWRALQVDHINGGGSHERRGYGHSPSALKARILDDVIKADHERRYQILCANCNWIKRYDKRELCSENRIFKCNQSR